MKTFGLILTTLTISIFSNSVEAFCEPGWLQTLQFCYLKLYGLHPIQAAVICKSKGGYMRHPEKGSNSKNSFPLCVKPRISGPLGSCFEDNTLIVEDSLPVKMSLEQCFKSCKAASACKVSKGCFSYDKQRRNAIDRCGSHGRCCYGPLGAQRPIGFQRCYL